ncbi:MAG: P-II family nitrogen regulator [Chloroflexota bacterium]|jgi:nitrogen regulatory protein P-II 1|nr:P-II family nitrogen regulator [Chloroflexota bacterium]MCY4455907.1 P-II family nitrogen regulator [Chloroflexota bacterium]MDE2696484.1 P-II family nitrogen regulator [Chloroflexota bacterium]MXW35744.1 P-II family nitrogen regulator [Chloroflexota bacterium]MXZ45582.1 P-II family nitrogen regulator [Chloroflexota bacterium]
MKMIIAYINPFRLNEIRDALREAGVTGLSAGNIQGFGRQAGHTETYRGAEYEVEFLPKVRIEVLVDDSLAPTVISTIEETARTGSIGDGKIAVLPLEDVVRIRTGERGVDAL